MTAAQPETLTLERLPTPIGEALAVTDETGALRAFNWTDYEPRMRAWQVRGGSESGEPVGWKTFDLHRVTVLRLSPERSRAPRDGYRRIDPAIHRVVCQV